MSVRAFDAQTIGAGEPVPGLARIRVAFLAMTKTPGVPFQNGIARIFAAGGAQPGL